MSLVNVVAAIIYNESNEILIAERPKYKHGGGLWEFPGGKVENNEAPFLALKRELKEELNIGLIKANPFVEINHDYGDKLIHLDVWKVIQYEGEPIGHEGQSILWVKQQRLVQYQFLEANKEIIAQLQNETVTPQAPHSISLKKKQC